MPTDLPTDVPTAIPETAPANVPLRKRLRPPLQSALGADVGDDTKIDVLDLPDRTPVAAAKIMTRPGRRPFATFIPADGGEQIKIPIYYSETIGLYLDNSEIDTSAGNQLVCKRLSPQYTVAGRPISGFLKIFA